MRKTFILLCILACAGDSRAQVKNTRHLLSFSTGFSQPAGRFGSAAADDPQAGWAGTGVQIQFGYTRMMTSRFGWTASLSGTLNPLRTEKAEQNLAQTPMLSAQPVVAADAVTLGFPRKDIYPNWDLQRGSWKTASLLVGGYQESSSRHLIRVFAKAQAGLVYAVAPAIEGRGEKSDSFQSSVHIQQTKAHAWGIGYELSAGFRSAIHKKLDFIVSASFTGTGQLQFKNVTAVSTAVKTVSSPSSPVPVLMMSKEQATGTARQSIQQLQLGAGIGWRF